jgi:hypothetical protein
MNYPSLKLALVTVFLAGSQLCFGADEPSDPSWKKAADNKIFAQTLADDALKSHSDLFVVGIHSNLPGTKDERMIACTLDRVGKVDDDDDKAGAVDGKTVLAPNQTEPNKFEILMPLKDKAGDRIGAVAFVFKYKQGDDEVKLLAKATKIRDGFAAKLNSGDDLFKPVP